VGVNGHAIPRNLRGFVGDTPFFAQDNSFDPTGYEAIFVDCSDANRAGSAMAAMFPAPAGNIDHHISNARFASENIVLPETAATCAMLSAFVFNLGLDIDPLTAQALYTGIVTDTGQFKFPSTTPEVLELAAQLLRCGACVRTTTRELYEQETFASLALLQRFLSSLTLHNKGRVCSGEIPLAAFDETGTTRENAEGFVDYARCIEGVDIAVLIEETPDGVKGSLRAKDERYRADLLAKKLNGGGHILASGFSLPNTTLADGRAHILETITAHLAEIDAQ
jgi:phosphoesterase RecJ-like protein